MDKGAHFYRCDFQIHTPRDLNWHGNGADTEAERKAYAEEFVSACRQMGVQAVAITDHHDVAFFRYLKEAASNETDDNGDLLPKELRLIVFPGMELTLGIPCQALLLLDAGFPVDLLDQVPLSLSITTSESSDPKIAQVVRLEHIADFEQVYSQLNQRDFLIKRFIVLPHVGESGNSTLMRSGFASKYKSMPCVGGFVDGSLSQHGEGNCKIVAGKVKEWGNKAIGLFQTSDNRRRDFADLGQHSTWVKWAMPTAEAIRQACLARESRLSQEEPQLPSIYITKIEVSNSHFLGPIDLSLNPQYNALIGGRGTGKSTILEYVRWALCDQPPSDHDSELLDFQRRRRDMIENTLEVLDATVSIAFLKNGIEHIVRRKTNTNDILLKIGNSEFSSCSEADVRNLLPIHAYSQKQLSSVGVKVEELERFIHAPVKNNLAQLDARSAELSTKLRTTYADLCRHRTLKAEIANLELERRSVDEQVKKLRKSLRGLSEADSKLIAQQSSYEQEEQVVASWSAEIARATTVLQGIDAEFANAPATLPKGGSPERDLLVKMQATLAEWFAGLCQTANRLRDSLDEESEEYALAEYGEALKHWRTNRESNRAAYQAAKERSTAHKGTLNQTSEIEGHLTRLDNVLGDKRRALQKLGEQETRFAEQRKEWLDLQEQGFQLVGQQCQELTVLSKELIRAKLMRGHRIDTIEERLRASFKGTKVRGERYEGIWKRIKESSTSVSEWSTILDELEILALTSVEHDVNNVLPNTPVLESLGFTLRERKAIAIVLTPEDWINLLLTPLEDLPVFEYRAREGDYIGFNMASAGQQATALMYVLLNQAGPPLLIDQPEDDLDNKVMGEIVREIWAAKSRRQLIFSSHNANLVVNGDAELVVCCDYRVAGDQSGGKVKLEGAIDIPEINVEITAVMEGGREAFSLRQAKYGF